MNGRTISLSLFSLLLLAPLLAPAQDSNNPTPRPAWMAVLQNAKALEQQSKFEEAEIAAKQALSIAKENGYTDDRLAASYYLLATIDRDRGHCAESRANFNHAIAIWEKQPNPKPEFLFSSIVNIINTATECGEFDTADKLYRAHRAELERYSSGPNDAAKLLSLKSALARGHHNYAESEDFLRQAIDTLQRAPATKPFDIAQLWSNLGVVIGKLGRPAEALADSERAIAILEQEGRMQPALVAALNNAACSLADLGRKEDAQRMFQRALDAASAVYGEENRVSANIMLNYARLLRENKQASESASMLQKGSEAFHRSLTQEKSVVDIDDLRSGVK